MGNIKKNTALIYLLVIKELELRNVSIKNNDLVAILNVSPASVSQMLRKLKKEDYVEKNLLKLTNKGEQIVRTYKHLLTK